MRIRRSLLLAGLLVAVSACTVESQGDPLPADPTGTTNPSGEELPFAGAPKVEDPLDTSRYEQNPCLSLTADQAQSLNLPPTGVPMENVALSVGCEWENPDTQGHVYIIFIVDDPRGLSPEYDANKRGKWKYFEELPDIEGYPAIARSGTDDRDIGGCSVLVGVADDMVFEVNLQLSEGNVRAKDPCKVAADVAGLAVQTMKGA